MELKDNLKQALEELRKDKKRKFDQTVDFIINLQKFDNRKNSLNLFVVVPNKLKEKKVCAFLETKNPNVDTITKDEFKNFKEKNQLKKIVKKFDFFISQASLMANVATVFGKVLGPAGKMPSPQLGILFDVNDKTISELKEKINNTLKIRTKEASIKVPVGKESMDDEKIIENIMAIYETVVKALPRDKENVKNVEIKFTMTKPQKIKIR